MADEILSKLGFDVSQALQALDNLDAKLKAVGNTMGQFANASKSLATTDTALKSMSTAFKTNTASAVNDMERMRTSMGLLSRVVFTQLVVRALSQIRNAFREATDSAIEFQTRLAEIGTISAGTGIGGMEEYGSQIRDLSDKWNIDLSDATKGLYETISNQIKQPFDFMESAAAFSKGSVTSMADSVRLLSGTLNAFELETGQTDAVASKFQKTIELGAVTGTELANVFGRVAPRAQQLGVSIEELDAAFATLTIRGLKADEAATQISGTMTALVKPSEAMKQKLKELGFSSSEVAVKTLGYGGVLKALTDSVNGSAEAMGKLFPNIRGLGGAVSIGAQANELYNKTLADIQGTASSLNQERGLKILSSDAQQVSKAFTQLSNIMTADLGQSLLKTGSGFLNLVGGVDNLKTALPILAPALVTGTGLLTAYGAAALFGATSNKAFMATFGGVAAGLLLVSEAIVGGKMIGNDLMAAYTDPIKAFDEQSKKAVETLRKQEADRLRLVQETESKRVQAVLAASQQLNRAYLEEAASATTVNNALVSSTERMVNRIVDAHQKLADAMRQGIEQSREWTRESQGRVADLMDRQGDRAFSRQLADKSDVQQVFAMAERAQAMADKAKRDLLSAATSGDKEALDRAERLFSKAGGLGDEAEAIAKRTGNRALEAKAIDTINSLTNKQIGAEKQLQQIQSQRQAALSKEVDSQQAVVDQLKNAAKLLTENMSMADKQGKPLSDAQLATQAQNRQKALQTILEAGFSQKNLDAMGALGLAKFAAEFKRELTQSPMELRFSVENGIKAIQDQLRGAFEQFKVGLNIDTSALESALGKTFKTPDEVLRGVSELQKKADALRESFAQIVPDQKRMADLKTEVAGILELTAGMDRMALRMAGTSPLAGTKQVSDIYKSIQGVMQGPVNAQQLTGLIDKLGELQKMATTSGGLAKNVGLGLDLENLSLAVGKLKELSDLQQKAADPGGKIAAGMNQALPPASAIEQAMQGAAIDEALKKVRTSCGKRKWKKEVIDRRVGKIMAKNSRAAGLYEVTVGEVEGRAVVSWQKNETWRQWATLNEGCYLLRTNVTDWSAEDLWQAYIQLTEAEAAFRIHKSDLRIRPVWHQTEERVQAHILVCFLAYILWKTLHQMTQAAGLGDEPRRIFEELGKINLVDVVLPTRQKKVEIRRRCVARPTDHQAILLDRLGLRLPRQLKVEPRM